jgi:hypothetical protein
MDRSEARVSASSESACACVIFPSATSLPTLALASAHSGESFAELNGAPVMTLRLPSITRSISNFGARMPSASDALLWATAVSSTAGMARRRAL